MKPVRLKLAGLHSFREPQVVDFENLCGCGLFGIFGPTGSGKSTILDAITLALYGKVERASHGTQGILNHAGDKVSVEFTFEIKQPEGPKRYRIERVYRRSGDNSVAIAGARLVEIIDGIEMPIAEKSKVTEEVTSMLGLTVDDFTRAVVLPQGKFDEFLKKIKPLERRRMLERLFGLSEYGDKLRQKVVSRLSEAENRMASVQGELEGLGDASDQALMISRNNLQKLSDIVEKSGQILWRAEKEFRENEQVRVWQEEKSAVEQALSLLRNKAPEIEEKKKKLDAAVRAGLLAPYLREVDESFGIYAESEANYREVAEKLISAGRAAENAENAFNMAVLQRRQEEPALLEKKSRLIRAVELESKLEVIRGEEAAAILDIKKLGAEKAGNEAALEKLKLKLNTLQQDISKLKTSIAHSQVDPEKRRQVQLSLLALDKWRKADEEKEKARADYKKKEDMLLIQQKALSEAVTAEQKSLISLERASAAEAQTRGCRPDDQDALRNSLKDLERLRYQISVIKKLHHSINDALIILSNKNAELEKARDAVNKAEAALLEAEQSREKAVRIFRGLEEKVSALRHRNMAYYLSRLLKEGDPCPVCGSVEHPAPLVICRENDLEPAEKELREAGESLEAAQKLLERVQRAESAAATNVNTAGIAAREARDRLESLKAEMKAARGNLPAPWAELLPEELEQEMERQENMLNKRERTLAEWQKNLEAAQEKLKAARDFYNNAKVSKVEAGAAYSSARSALGEALQRLNSAEQEAGKYLNQLNAVRGDIAVDKITGEQQKIERFDAERLNFEKQREALELKLIEVSGEIERLSDLNNDLALGFSRSREKLEGIRNKLKEYEIELTGICHGQPAGKLLEQTDARLEELVTIEQQARKEMNLTSEIKSKLDQSLAAAEKAFKIAGERLAKGKAKLNKGLEELHFVTRNEAEQALLGKTEQVEIQKAVDEYQSEKERLSGLLRSLEEKLNGRTLAPEEWQGLQDRLKSARREYDAALTARGAAVREYEKLTGANARWKELNNQVNEISALKAKLDILKDLLRGNALVDFLAEEQLIRVTSDASIRLGQLTKHRYALEVDSEGGFIIRDEANGGVKRPVSSLSGGETFVASLALALALSSQIQLKGCCPLEFFFLDEGFGALDPDLLEVVVATLERLRLEHLNIGVISHVPELKNRLPRRLIVHPAQASGIGSRLEMEFS